ncbi:hypothetical protein [Pseudoalteromonas denitrificans]|uniref:Uncharacterized protein n=1 Tax=Pseudoalteromonas denitrificans DSM 6059 TaxID=1123010 RepID=A0A1I1QCQ8_9GAMM|nr:hypothetical protein [Pseudoalteromonas denitrificans]SFD19752.1 hypothetical protein SAMN02745724_03831 [Pseudoalteromonas denitrificans DSM 6059]
MNTHEVKAGMFVEYHMSLSEVIAVNRTTEVALIQRHSDHQKFVVNVVDLFEDRQLNSDSDMYYWGC